MKLNELKRNIFVFVLGVGVLHSFSFINKKLVSFFSRKLKNRVVVEPKKAPEMNHPITVNGQEKMESIHSVKNAIGKECSVKMFSLYVVLLCCLSFSYFQKKIYLDFTVSVYNE